MNAEPQPSPLLSFPPEIMSDITERLNSKDVLELFIAVNDKTRRFLTHKGGIKSLAFRNESSPESFPLFHRHFASLETLKILITRRWLKTFTVGSFMAFPPSLVHLELNVWGCWAAWLQPATWTGNNDDEQFASSEESVFKPIYIDRLLPKLKTLKLSNSSDLTFSPQGHPAYPYRAFFGHKVVVELLKVPKLQMDMRWTTEMRSAWFDHLPKGLASISVGIRDDVDVLALLPPYLTELEISSQTTGTLSRLSPTLQESLLSLELTASNSNEFFDTPLPPNLTSFHFMPSWTPQQPLVCPFLDSLPHSLTKLHLGNQLSPRDLPMLSPKIIELRIGLESVLTPDDITSLPSGLKRFTLSCTSTFNLGLVQYLPRSLTYLYIADRNPYVDFAIDDFLNGLPSSLTTLQLDHLSVHLPSYILSRLPTSLNRLTLSAYGWPASAAMDIPPNLTSLELIYIHWPDTVLGILPRTLTHVRIYYLMATGALLSPDVLIMNRETLTDSVTKNTPEWLQKKPGMAQSPLEFTLVFDHPYHIPPHVTTLDLDCPSFEPRLLRKPYIYNSARIPHGQLVYDFQQGQHHPHIAPPRASPNPYAPSTLDLSMHHFTDSTDSETGIVTYPNVTTLRLKNISTFSKSLFWNFPNLVTLDIPGCFDLSAPSIAEGWDPAQIERPLLIPQSLTALNAPKLTRSEFLFPPDQPLPPNLKSINLAQLCYQGFGSKIAALKQLESLSIEVPYNFTMDDPLPETVTDLHLKGYRAQGKTAERPPPNIRTLEIPFSYNDRLLQKLPKSLTHLTIFEMNWLAEDYSSYPRSTSKVFKFPESMLELARETRFSEVASSAPSLSSSSPSNDSEPEQKTVFPVEKDQWLRYFQVKGSQNFKGPIADLVSPTVETLIFNQNLPEMAWSSLISNLPTTITHLDMEKIEHIKASHLTNLPSSLLTLALHGAELNGDVIQHLPRSLTSLTFFRMPGRLTAARAKFLPPALLTLSLGSFIIGDDAVCELPRSLTELNAPNCPFITIKSGGDFPPGLQRLALPTSRLTYEGAVKLPPSLTFLNLGSGCNVPTSFIISTIQTAAALRESTTVTAMN